LYRQADFGVYAKPVGGEVVSRQAAEKCTLLAALAMLAEKCRRLSLAPRGRALR
jgi:hypothetical protein